MSYYKTVDNVCSTQSLCRDQSPVVRTGTAGNLPTHTGTLSDNIHVRFQYTAQIDNVRQNSLTNHIIINYSQLFIYITELCSCLLYTSRCV